MEYGYYEIMFKILKIIAINFFTIYTSSKIINKNSFERKIKNNILCLIFVIIVSIFNILIEDKTNKFYSIVYLIIFLTLFLSKTKMNSISYSLIVSIISLGLNYILFFIAVSLCGIINTIFHIGNIYTAILIFFSYLILLKIFFLPKRLKNGFSFIKQNNILDENLDNIALNISVVIIFFVTVFADPSLPNVNNNFFAIILISIIMFITISKSFQLYYKHRLLMKELDRLNAEIEDLNKNNKELETENIEINKINHTLSHKQKALEHKINKLLMNTEIAKEITPVEEKDIKEKLEDISKEIYKEKSIVTLKKTEIPNIDNMLEFLQEECTKNKIEFELQILGNIFYMINHYITKEDLEILIADHVKDAIIAVNHSDNEYRSILVRLGKIDNIYSLYIYDSGIEFEEETLNNLGKKPCTTHAEEGGSGLGFMNTFDTLRKYKASLTIKEISKPTKENYTKIIIIKFDGLNEFTIDSYKKQQNVKIKN